MTTLLKAIKDELKRKRDEAEDRYTKLPLRWRRHSYPKQGDMKDNRQGSQIQVQGQQIQGQEQGQGAPGERTTYSATTTSSSNSQERQHEQNKQDILDSQRPTQPCKVKPPQTSTEQKPQCPKEEQKDPLPPKEHKDEKIAVEHTKEINTQKEKTWDRISAQQYLANKYVEGFTEKKTAKPTKAKERKQSTKFRSPAQLIDTFDYTTYTKLTPSERYDPMIGLPSSGAAKASGKKDNLKKGLLVDTEAYHRQKIIEEQRQLRQVVSGTRNRDKAYDINFLREKRLERAFSVVMSKLAEDLAGLPTEGDDEWDINAIIARTINHRPLSQCRQSREKESVVILLDTSGSCYCQADFYRKVATAAVREGDVELYTAPNASVQQRYTHDASWVNLDKSYDLWPFKGRTIIFFGDFDGAPCICEASKKNKIYWFCSESRHKRIEQHSWSEGYKDSDFYGIRYRDVFQEEDFVRLAKKLRG